ncbi:autorepressor SdpR family transcription factor [Clostridium sp. CS001]|uniref:autorepressor SdpR family transcription factor n=1 Tax=Clostridium sp. CS001 TaxID=2880648 RepID=UPI001CF2FDFF|nr:autorepressor SdpR family transcription factor [Clostridium sp. CS001]MCB2290611.1 autorepressor SdpR family transcription factor [Clostridium sp. CS001]
MAALNLPFKALADPTRRKIIMLLKKESLTAGEIAEHFDMTKPSISHHLNTLKQADLVSDERKGQNIYYTLNTTVFQEVIGWFFDATHYNEDGDDINNEKDS